MSAIDGYELVEEPPLPFDTGDAAQVKAKIKRAKSTEERRAATLKGFLSSPDGREWFYHVLADCGVFKNPFASDAMLTAFSCGEMNVGQRLLSEIVAAGPELYMQMLKESRDG